MLAQVILFRRMPPNITYFDYLVPITLVNQIKIGQLVEVPFRSNVEFGLIYSLDQDKNRFKIQTKLRALNKICFPTSFLPKTTLDFLQEISQFYATDLGFIYKFSLPKFTKKFFTSLSNKDLPEIKIKKEIIKPKVVVIQNKKDEEVILRKNLTNVGQNLILVPEKSDIDYLNKILKKDFPVEILSSDITDKNTTALWQKIRKGNDTVVIGTRKALFLPWVNLKNIFIFDEGNENYKSWDMAPRYHTRDAALLLSQFNNCKVFLISHTPSVSSFYFFKEKKYEVSGELSVLKNTFKLIDLNLEKRAKNFTPLSFELVEELKSLGRNDSSFLFINKKGSAGYLFCGDCKKPLICKKCGRPLSYFGVKKEMRCNFCEITESLVGACPNCQSYNLKMRNPGTESVEKELHKFPELKHFKIVRLDSESETENIIHRPGTIYVGTEMAWNIIPWSQIKLAAFLNTDSALTSAEYKNLEHLWQKIRDSFYKSSSKAKIFLQGSHLDHYLFSSLTDPKSFYANQLQERSLFQYPPFNFWLKLIIADPNANSTAKQANDLKYKLETLTKTLKNANVSGPHQAIPYFQKGRYRHILLVRLGYDSYRSAVKEINKIIPKNWKVDPNPNTLLSL
ncbi:MAG: primosomal protein N' [Candidatus Magasanikbacteria bacterium]|nr:primosomal protein N' [Candidatus Magasanikbacteria bacterium]